MRNKPATDTFEGEYTSNPMSNSTQNKGQSEWLHLTFPVEFPDRDINFKLSMYARTIGNVDLSQMQVSGESFPISDGEILRRMFDRRISRPFWSSINRVKRLFSKDE